LEAAGRFRDGDALLARLANLDRARRYGAPAAPAPGKRITSVSFELPPVVALGASTGGPEALARILSELPADFPAAMVIAQHIAAEFGANLAEWLQRRAGRAGARGAEGVAPRARRGIFRGHA